MNQIIINNCAYNIHPIYDLYAGSKDGSIIHILIRVAHKGNKTNRGYLNCMVRKHSQSGFKHYHIHKFIWECFYCIIPDGKEIDHKNNDKEDNRLCNLQLLTHQQNCKKAVKHRKTFNSQQNRKCVKATNKETNEVTYYYSMYSVEQHLIISHNIIRGVCEGHYGCKSGISKRDGHWYTFEYIKEEDLPQNYIKSKNIRPRKVSDEDKKKHRVEYDTKDWKCPNCEKVLKNYSRFKHIKKCDSQQ